MALLLSETDHALTPNAFVSEVAEFRTGQMQLVTQDIQQGLVRIDHRHRFRSAVDLQGKHRHGLLRAGGLFEIINQRGKFRPPQGTATDRLRARSRENCVGSDSVRERCGLLLFRANRGALQ